MSQFTPIKRALLSVSNKTDLVAFASRLISHGVQIISTGGTAAAIRNADIPVTSIDQVTNFPEMMGGRVKTLHPRIHGGLLALRDEPDHATAMQQHGIEPIDLVCVNLYPFENTIAAAEVTDAEAIEQIDIGGPSMLRSAAKNFRYVVVVTDPSQYDQVANELDKHDGATTTELRRSLATVAFSRTAKYDAAIAEWMSYRTASPFPESLVLRADRQEVLRYGENPHQTGALYVDPKCSEPSVATSKQLHGKQLSFNNLYDANAALELVKEIDPTSYAAAAVIKHANPCGFAIDKNAAIAFDKAYHGDPLAAFGGIVAFNRPIDLATADRIIEGNKFLEMILAPAYENHALDLLTQRWKNVRILTIGPITRPANRDANELDIKRITGGLLIQQRDLAAFETTNWKHVAGPEPSESAMRQMQLAMVSCKYLKSNAVCIVRDNALVGAGTGQMDRLASCSIAVQKSGERAKGGYAASDGLFPFRDGPDQLIAGGVAAIVQPGGSMRDDETIAACHDAAVTLILTGQRHFRH